MGHTVTIWVCVGAGLLHLKSPMLPFSVDGCSDNVWDQVGNKTQFFMSKNVTVNVARPEMYDHYENKSHHKTFMNKLNFHLILNVNLSRDWPQKIHTVSFLLYPVIGCAVCMSVGIIVSLITGKNKIAF